MGVLPGTVGAAIRMVSYPDGKAYEAGRERLLWSPVHPQD